MRLQGFLNMEEGTEEETKVNAKRTQPLSSGWKMEKGCQKPRNAGNL